MTEQEILKAVAAIKASGVLGKSARRARLLEYLVARELAGEGARIKAMSIAMDVFDRGAEFDPNTDSIVRTEIGRLREALDLFAARHAGDGAPLIRIPKGTYRPVFDPAPGRKRHRAALAAGLALALALGAALFSALHRSPAEIVAEAAEPLSDLPYRVLRVAVMPPKATGTHEETATLAFGLYSQLVTDLSAYPWIAVIAPLEGFHPTEAEPADYVLKGRLLWQDDTLTAHAELVSLDEHEVVWSHAQRLHVTPGAIREAERVVATGIVQRLAARHGIAPELVKALNARFAETQLQDLLCFMGFHTYVARPTDARHAELRDCLSAVVAAYPHHGEAWAALALMHMDEARFLRNPRPGARPWDEARAELDEALKYAPLRMPVLNIALIHAIEAPVRDLDAFEHHAARLLELFPRHPDTLALVGSRLAGFEGRWDAGLALIDQALRLEPNPPSWFFLPGAMHALLHDDPRTAWAAAQRLTLDSAKIERIVTYLAAAAIGDERAMGEQRALLAARGLATKDQIIAHVRNRRYHPALETALVERLDRAFAGDGS